MENYLSIFAANEIAIDLRLNKANDSECLLRDCSLILMGWQ